MMFSADNHPDEELLIAHALDDDESEDMRIHVAGCVRCAQIVRESRVLKDKLAALDDAEIPARLRQQILDTTRKKSRKSGAAFDWINDWYKNPFILTGIVIAFVVVVFVILSFGHG